MPYLFLDAQEVLPLQRRAGVLPQDGPDLARPLNHQGLDGVQQASVQWPAVQSERNAL